MENRIRALRKSLGLSQEELAKGCGVSRQTINAIENNKYDPSLALAFHLARELETTVDALFIPNDNTVASALPVLAQEAIAAGLPVYPTADSMVRDGGLATVGINYTVLGGQTADMVCRVLEGTPIADIPVELVNESSVVVNGDTAAALGVDVSRYVQ